MTGRKWHNVFTELKADQSLPQQVTSGRAQGAVGGRAWDHVREALQVRMKGSGCSQGSRVPEDLSTVWRVGCRSPEVGAGDLSMAVVSSDGEWDRMVAPKVERTWQFQGVNFKKVNRPC